MKKYTAILLVALTVLIAFAADTVNAADNVSSRTNVCNVIGTNYKCDSWSDERYLVIDLFGENYVPLLANNDPIWQSHVNKLAKLVLDSNETYTLKDGEKLDLGQGYSLEVKQIDIDNEKVWLEFTKDGQHIADQKVSVNAAENKTWNVTFDNAQGENDIVVMKVYVNNLFVGVENCIVWIDGIWLIDYANAKTLNIGDKFGEFTLEKIISGADASNLGSLIFKKTQVVNSSSPVTSGKGSVKFTNKSTGSPTSWYWDFWRCITMKSK